MRTCVQLSYSHPNSRHNNLLLAGISAVCILTVLVLEMASGDNSPVTLALLAILISGFTALWQFRRHGFDPLGLFCLCFSLYDGVLLLRLTLLSNSSAVHYPTTFSSETYAAAGALCVIAAMAILLTTFLCELTVGSQPSAFKQPCTTESAAWFWAGFCSYMGGIALYYLQFEQFGGYLASLAISRVQRFELSGQGDGLSYPYVALVVPGIACLCYGSQLSNSRFRRVVFYALTTLWCVLVLLQGDRRLFLQAALTVMGVLAVIKPHVLRMRAAGCVLILGAYCFFAVFGYARSSITSIAAGEISPSQAVSELSAEMSDDWLTPEHSEFAGPYLSLLMGVSGHSEKLLGSSYYESFLTVLPKFLYPGEKPEVLAQQLAQDMYQGLGAVSGWGYNPVAEAFINFGALGVVLIFALWTIYFLLLRWARHRGDFGVLVSAVLLAEAVNVNRIDFRNVYWETTYFVVGLIGSAVLAVVFKTLQRKLVPSNLTFVNAG